VLNRCGTGAQRAAVDTQAGRRRERQERDRRIDALAVEVLVGSINGTSPNGPPGSAAGHDLTATTFAAPGGRLARRHHHDPERVEGRGEVDAVLVSAGT
jgi:hypothetical protein